MRAPPVVQKGSAQKLVTIYLDNMVYAKGKVIVGSFADKHGLIEEHLNTYLAQGWKVVDIHGFGGNSDGISVRGWITVFLERVTDA